MVGNLLPEQAVEHRGDGNGDRLGDGRPEHGERGELLASLGLDVNGICAAVRQARDEGLPAYAETCPQYLFLSYDDYERPGFEGAKYVFTPPLREKWHQEKLWNGLKRDHLQVVSTDHCPFCFKEQKEMGLGDFSKIPNGIGSVEHRMDLIFQGVVDGKITLERWVELCSTTPARMFGLYGRKGDIKPGFDADIVVYDPSGRTEIGLHKTHHMNMDHSAWEGFSIDGHVDTVLSRGKVVIDGNQYLGAKGDGIADTPKGPLYVPRSIPGDVLDVDTAYDEPVISGIITP